jgi:ADP-ribose pyrophosphatase
MTAPWTLLSENLQYDGYRKISRRVYQLPDGRDDVYEIQLEPEVVAILAMTPDRRFLMVKQFRPGPGATLVELPGGRVEPGEEPSAAARRELMEETGCEGDLHFLAETFQGAVSTMRLYCFVATNCRRVNSPQPDTNEFFEGVELSLEEFRALLRSGQLTDVAAGYLGLDYLGLL